MSVSSLVSQHARLYPNQIAVSHGCEEISFADLDAQSSLIAWLLHSRGVRRGDIVPILTSRCILMVVSLLAIGKLGAGYVPIDAETWAVDRIHSVLDTVYTKLAITTQAKPHIDFHDDKNFVSREDLEDVLTSKEIIAPLTIHASPDDPAYIIFTSGTSSKPKGVIVLNKSLSNYVSQRPFNLDIKHGDKVILIFSIGFDACTGVIFSTICNGGRLLLSSPSSFSDDIKLCTVLPATPSILSTLQDSSLYPNITSIFLGGEAPSRELVSMWWSPSRRMFNAYGPTETTISSTIAELTPDSPIVLGNTMIGSRVLLLNSHLEEDVEGQICISGPGLAKGYFQNEELTTSKFIRWKDGLRIYLTGDFGRMTPAGIVFCGRQDTLVKNRGFLINLDTEVIAGLRTFPGIINATALMNNSRLVGFVTPITLNPPDIRKWLLERYDAFLVPDIIRTMETLPLSVNGKIDNDSLNKELSLLSSGDDHDQTPHKLIDTLVKVTSLALNITKADIDLDKSFWDLGGNSLSAIKLVSYLHKEALTISVADLFSSPTLDAAVELIHQIDDKKDFPDDNNNTIDDSFAPMTTLQSSLARSYLQTPTSNYMILSMSCDDSTLLQGDTLKTAWIKVLNRHSIFRTEFDTARSIQSVNENLVVDWEELAVEAGQEIESVINTASRDLVSIAAKQPGRGLNTFRPVNAFRLVKSSTQSSSTILWLVHHIQIDGWSISVIFKDLGAVLSGSNSLAYLPPFTFSHFVRQSINHAEKTHDQAMQFWRSNCPSQHHSSSNVLRVNKSKPEDLCCSLDTTSERTLEIGITLYDLEEACRGLQVSPATVIYTAWAMTLQIYLNEDRVLFGAVLSGRNFPLAAMDELVGPVINTCPFPVDLTMPDNGDKTKLLQSVQTILVKMMDYQWSANEYLESIPGGYNELLSTIIAIEYDLPEVACPWPSSGNWNYRHRLLIEHGLMVLVEQHTGGMLGTRFQYASDQFDPRKMARMQRHFHNIIYGILDLSTSTLGQVRDRMIDIVEVKNLAAHEGTFNGVKYDGPSNLKDAFEEAADKFAEHAAVEEASGQCMTYSDLDKHAEHLAMHLRTLIKPNDVIAALSDGSLTWLITTLAIIKAGAVCAPVDHMLPARRKEHIVTESGAVIYIISSRESSDLVSISKTRVLCLEDIPSYNGGPTVRPRSETLAKFDDPAFLIFTSGSTGIPKGVIISHGPILSYLNVPEARLHSTTGRRNAQAMSVGFDVCIAELFGTLCYGATLVLKDTESPFSHLSRVDATMATPSLLSSLESERFPNLDTIFLAGEDVPQTLVNDWGVGPRRLYNGYGPCECTIVVLICRLQAGQEVRVGRPVVPGTKCSIRDGNRRRVPIGVPGEIWISGTSVTKGYINNKTETTERFVKYTDSPTNTIMSFCTGDMAQWTESMEIQYLGRKDRQVKVRGFRIELHEVERAILLASAGTVKEVSAIVHDENIYAFVTPAIVDVAIIHRIVSDTLPHYAQPTAIKALPQIPLGANMKIDTTLLQEIATHPAQQSMGNELTTAMEKLVGQIWKEVLNLDDSTELNLESDFLRLGGNSLKQVKFLQKLSRVLDRTIPFAVLLRNFTLSHFVRALERHCSESPGHEATLPFSEKSFHDYNGVSYLEEEIYNLHSVSGERASAFNVICNLRLEGDIDVKTLAQAVDLVIAEVSILRSRFVTSTGKTVQRLIAQDTDPARIIESDPSFIDDRVNTPFKVSHDQLIRAIISVENSETVSLVLVLHHIIADKRAVNIILERISRNYINLTTACIDTASQDAIKDATKAGQSSPHGSSVVWKPNPIFQAQDLDMPEFWKGCLPQLRESIFHQKPGVRLAKGKTCQWEVGPFLTIPNSSSSSSAIYLAASALAIRAVFGIDQMVVGIPYSNRLGPNTNETVGTFLDRLPICIDCTDSTNVDSFIKSIESSVRAALTHSIPYGKLRELLSLGNDYELFDVMFIYHDPESSYAKSLVLPGITAVVEVPTKPKACLFPLVIEVYHSISAKTIFQINYDSSLLEAQQIETLKDTLSTELSTMMECAFT